MRPGTLPVPLIAGFGLAAQLALSDNLKRRNVALAVRIAALAALEPLKPTLIGDQLFAMPHVLSLAFSGMDSEALMLALKDLVALSNGSACTSANYQPSHVLLSMGLPEEVVEGAVRLSWSHLAPAPDWSGIAAAISSSRLDV